MGPASPSACVSASLSLCVCVYEWINKILKKNENIKKKYFIYLFMRDTKREGETQAEREAGSLQGAQCGARSQDSGITP